MFNIAIEQYPGKIIYVSHNNPTINNIDILGRTLTKFRYEKHIDADSFVATLILNIAKCDNKKSPVFYLGTSTVLGENSGAIAAVSIPNNKMGYFHETGKPIDRLYDCHDFISFLESGNRAPNPNLDLLRATNPPDKYDFSLKVSPL